MRRLSGCGRDVPRSGLKWSGRCLGSEAGGGCCDVYQGEELERGSAGLHDISFCCFIKVYMIYDDVFISAV